GASGFGISDVELSRIVASVVRIGISPGNTGTITVDGAVTRHPGYNTLSLMTGNTATNPFVASPTGAITQTATLSVANLAVQTVGGVQLTNAGNNVDAIAGSVTGGSFLAESFRLVDA